MWGRVRSILGLAFLILLSTTAWAEPLDADKVPQELRPWIGWVQDELGDEVCTSVAATRRCVWLGRVAVEASSTEARFTLQVVTERRTAVPLPGSAEMWPEGVEVEGKGAVVLSEGGVPVTTLPAGDHTVKGTIPYAKLPEVLALPQSVARVALTIDGEPVVAPRRTEDGGVWLGGASKDGGEDRETETESLDIAVTRHIEDAVPLVVTTRIELRVGGRPREVRLAGALLEGGELLELKAGKLSARFEADRTLALEARSGNHTIELTARHGASAESLRLEKAPAPWPASEVWAWAPDVKLRQVEVSGGSPIDPGQTRLPEAWRKLSAYKLNAPTTFAMKTLRRGQSEPEPNTLRMSRRIILDFDGGGYTVVDGISGTMRRDWRLDFGGAETLGNVRVAQNDEVVTVEAERLGVELREGNVMLAAASRGSGAPSSLDAVGWQADMDALEMVVTVPPGWELLWASGVDHVSPSRLARWELVDLLLVLALALAIGKLCGWAWAPVAAVAFALARDADHLAWWAWAPLLAAAYLIRRVPEGRWRQTARVARMAAASVLVYALVVFASDEARDLLYPEAARYDHMERQLEEEETEQVAEANADNKEGGTGTRAKGDEGSMGRYAVRRNAKLRDSAEFGMIGLLNTGAGGDPDAPTAPWDRDDSLGSDPLQKQKPLSAVQDPLAVIQTGPGVPKWEYTRYDLSWVGPVKQGHQIRLWLLAPWMRTLLTLLGVALSAAVLVRLLRTSVEPETPSEGPQSYRRNAAAAALLALWAGLLIPAPAHAQTPSRELLDELKTRLTRAPACTPECVTVSRLLAKASGTTLEITAEVHVGARAVYQLPGPAASWVPATVEIDGKPASALATIDGHLHLRVPAGRHTVKLVGPLVGDALTLALGTPPHRVRTVGNGWVIEGVDDAGKPEASIVIHRTPSAAAPDDEPDDDVPNGRDDEPAEPLTISPWLEVTRILEVGVKWTMRTNVRRVSAVGTPIAVTLPLMEGEQVTEGSGKQEGRGVTVTLGKNEQQASFVSALKPSSELSLVAAENEPWTETWILACDPMWRCRHSGIAPVAHMAAERWRPKFEPWPGEKVTFQLERLRAAEGRTLTIQAARLKLDVGDRVTRASLEIHLHSSTGGVHSLQIPEGVRVEQLRVGSKAQPLEGSGGALNVALDPGRQTIHVAWQESGGASTFYRAPEIVLGDQVVNAHVSIDLPRGRWLVYARGPGMGPDIQLWGYLLLLIVIALGVSRIPDSPLKPWQWVLLAAGLTQVPVPIAMLVGAWFFIITHRRRWELGRRTHNAVQVIVAASTLAFALAILVTAYEGVAKPPWMMIATSSGPGLLNWYVDRTAGAMPRPWVLSTSTWVWRLLMAAWSAWVAVLLYPWAGKAWESFKTGGLWRRAPATAAAAASPSPPSDEIEVPTPATAGAEADTDADTDADADSDAVADADAVANADADADAVANADAEAEPATDAAPDVSDDESS